MRLKSSLEGITGLAVSMFMMPWICSSLCLRTLQPDSAVDFNTFVLVPQHFSAVASGLFL